MNDILLGKWSVDRNGNFTEVSAPTLRILGLSSGASITLADYVCMISEKDRQTYLDARYDAYQHGELKMDYRLVINGQVKWIREVSQFDIQSDNSDKPATTLIQDISEFRMNGTGDSAKQLSGVSRELASSMLAISEQERKKAAKALHDDVSQRLAVVSIELGSVNDAEAPTTTIHKVKKIKSDLVSISDEIHKLSRQLYPSVIEHLGFVEALRSEIDNFQRRERIDAKFITDIESITIERKVELALFRMVQEALSNIAMHSEAYLVSVKLTQVDDCLLLQIEDNGMGFDVENNQEKQDTG